MPNPFSKLFWRDGSPRPDLVAAPGTPPAEAPAATAEKPKRGRADHLKDFRFPEGVSGNPGGRPKNRSTKAVLNELLEMLDSQGITARERLAEVVLAKALKGNIRFVRELYDRADGRPKQAVDLDGNITIRVEYADSHADTPEAPPGPAEDPVGPETV